MNDKNGTEIKKGDIVEISGAFFKNDNGLWVVKHAPGDEDWTGKDYCLNRLNKNGTVSKRKDNICFWPIIAMTSNRLKNAEARKHNAEFATIEVVSLDK